MDSDETLTIDDAEDAAWVRRQRQVVIDYLVSQRCDHNDVSLEPRWFVSPYVALWAVQSRATPDRVGWWAISGDVPTDYLSAAAHLRTAGDILIAFADQWRAAAERMKDSEHLGAYVVGDPSRATELAPLLRRRANLLQKFGEDLNNDETAGGG
jgi:hypothetical protein